MDGRRRLLRPRKRGATPTPCSALRSLQPEPHSRPYAFRLCMTASRGGGDILSPFLGHEEEQALAKYESVGILWLLKSASIAEGRYP